MKTLKILLIVGLLFTIAADEVTPEPVEEPYFYVTPELPLDCPTPEPEPTMPPPPPEPALVIPVVYGCTDSRAMNYIPSNQFLKVVNDGSCYYLSPPPAEPKHEHHEEWIFPEPEPVYIYADYSDLIEANMATLYAQIKQE